MNEHVKHHLNAPAKTLVKSGGNQGNRDFAAWASVPLEQVWARTSIKVTFHKPVSPNCFTALGARRTIPLERLALFA